jgi:hypothetical protein
MALTLAELRIMGVLVPAVSKVRKTKKADLATRFGPPSVSHVSVASGVRGSGSVSQNISNTNDGSSGGRGGGHGTYMNGGRAARGQEDVSDRSEVSVTTSTTQTDDATPTTRHRIRSFAEVLATPVVIAAVVPAATDDEESRDKSDDGVPEAQFSDMRIDGNLLVLRKKRQFRNNSQRAAACLNPPSADQPANGQ